MTNSPFTNNGSKHFPPAYSEGNAQFRFISTIQLFDQLGASGWFGLGSKALQIKLPTFAPDSIAQDSASIDNHRCFSIHSQYLDDHPAMFAQILAAIRALGPQQLSEGFESLLD
jgi:hypothetical protein